MPGRASAIGRSQESDGGGGGTTSGDTGGFSRSSGFGEIEFPAFGTPDDGEMSFDGKVSTGAADRPPVMKFSERGAGTASTSGNESPQTTGDASQGEAGDGNGGASLFGISFTEDLEGITSNLVLLVVLLVGLQIFDIIDVT